MAIHLGCRLLGVPGASSLNPCSARNGADMGFASNSQVWSDMLRGNGGTAVNPPILPTLHLSGHTAE